MTPPRVFAWIARLAAGPTEAAFLQSDLAEEFQNVKATAGALAARRWYRRQVLRSVVPLLGARLIGAGGAVRRTNLRYTLRLIMRAPVMSAAVVATLALGIGANTAVFSVIDAVVLQPLPFARPDELVSVSERTDVLPRSSVAPGNVPDYLAGASAFDSVGVYRAVPMTLAGLEAPESLVGEEESANLLSLLGAAPAIGRSFAPADADPANPATAILTDRLWRRRFGANAAVVGQSIKLGGEPRVVIGVMAAPFEPLTYLALNQPIDFLVPTRQSWANAPRSDHMVGVVGRLRPGATIDLVRQQLAAVARRNAERFPDSNGRTTTVADSLQADLTRRLRPSLLLLAGAVALVALIACANVANLLLVWMSGQRHEFGVRLALGARGADVLVDALSRGLVLAAAGGAAGFGLGLWLRDVLVALAPAVPSLHTIHLNIRVLATTLVMTGATGLIAGTLPALPFLSGRPAGALRASGRSGSGERAMTRWRGILLVAEVAAAVTLACGAGVLLRSLLQLQRVPLGFRTEHVLTMQISPSRTRYPDAAARLRFFDQLSERFSAVPGVAGVAFANQFPLGGGWSGKLQVDGPGGPIEGEADLQVVSPSYFQVFDIRLERGRLLTADDRATSAPVVVVSSTFASHFAPGRNPLGLRLRRSADAPTLTVVGVVNEIRRDGKLEPATPQVYFAAAQIGLYAASLETVAVRTRGEPASVVPAIRAAVHQVEPDQLVTRVADLDVVLDGTLATRRFSSWLLGCFAVVALLLSVCGIYGVVAHIVAQRTREIGVRLALGATRAHVIRLCVLVGVRWAAGGVVVGLVGAVMVSRLFTSLLFEVTPTDPLTYASIAAFTLAVSAAASYIPSRRAAGADPLSALRAD
jgi:putative ABC transport system permease protein